MPGGCVSLISPSPTKHQSQPRGAGSMAARPRILVVEDDPLVREVIGDALADSYETIAAESASEALVSMERGGVDLILLDCTLPGGLGDRLIPEADRARVPIVLMSGNPEMAAQVPGN